MSRWFALAVFSVMVLACGNAAAPADSPWQPDVDKLPNAKDVGDPGTDEPGTDEPGTPEDAAGAQDTAAPQGDATEPVEDTTAPSTDVQQPPTDAAQPPEDTVEPQPDVKPDTKTDTGAEVNPKCIDEDGDTFGKYCAAGPDCDDLNPNFAKACPECGGGNVPGCPCKGIAAPCYSGDANWVGKGICKAGVQSCKDGFWSECAGEVMPENEACDNVDNDCDGTVDEGVKSSCGNCDMTCSQQGFGPTIGTPFELNSENSTGVGTDQNGYIVIDQQKISLNLKYIWVANSSENSVSKVDCKTGWETGRYKVCANPSRTSVDLLGNVWVACRNDGRVTKIIK